MHARRYIINNSSVFKIKKPSRRMATKRYFPVVKGDHHIHPTTNTKTLILVYSLNFLTINKVGSSKQKTPVKPTLHLRQFNENSFLTETEGFEPSRRFHDLHP